MALPLPDYVDGNHTVATPVTLSVLSKPFPGVNIDYVLEQEFEQFSVNAVPLALNTAHPDYAASPFAQKFILVEEAPQQDLGGGLVKWKRTYARVPATYSQPSSVPYNFIGYSTLSSSNNQAVVGRVQTPKVVAARVQYDYFLLDTIANVIRDASGNAVQVNGVNVTASIVNIPTLQEQRYYSPELNAVASNIPATIIGYAPGEPASNPTPQLNYPISPGTPVPQGAPAAAYPTRGEYEKWIARTSTVKSFALDGAGTNWVQTDTGIYEIVAQASSVNRWKGNIIERQTIYIRPQ